MKSNVSVQVVRKKPVAPPPSSYYVTFNLNEKDAKAFLALSRRISGCEANTLRGQFDHVIVSLENAGLMVDSNDYVSTDSRVHFIYE
jgi:hypothetical protein